jgi:hypothetical protein
LFDDKAKYDRVKNSRVLTADLFASLYKCSPNAVKFFECDNALGFKYSMPRPRVQGDLGDADLHGGQQYVMVMDIEIP